MLKRNFKKPALKFYHTLKQLHDTSWRMWYSQFYPRGICCPQFV